MAEPLTKRQRQILDFVTQFIELHRYSPSYREIATALFGVGAVSGRGWKSHDLRDRTIRLVHFGLAMMQGGYRLLLLHPHRRRP